MYVRKPVVAGQFYDSNPQRLKKQIETFLAEAQAENQGDVYGIIAPHAGYIYSGSIAASAYARVQNRDYDSVLIFAPSHRYRLTGASVITEGIYQSPLGDSRIDSDIASALIDEELFSFVPEVHKHEHSLEVQVPFVQTVLPDALLVPVILGTTEYSRCLKIGKRAAEKIRESGKKVLIVVSTDLSHFLAYTEAVSTDKLFCDALSSFDTAVVRASIEKDQASACGYGPVLAGMTAAKALGAQHCSVVDYRNSGDTAGPKNEVVGYCAAVFT